MEFSHSDTELIRQPIGYWSWAAYKAVVTYIREGLSEFGLSQPQWWTLNQVFDGGEDGRTRDEVRAVLQGANWTWAPHLEPEIDALLDRGLLTATPHRRHHHRPAPPPDPRGPRATRPGGGTPAGDAERSTTQTHPRRGLRSPPSRSSSA